MAFARYFDRELERTGRLRFLTDRLCDDDLDAKQWTRLGHDLILDMGSGVGEIQGLLSGPGLLVVF